MHLLQNTFEMNANSRVASLPVVGIGGQRRGDNLVVLVQFAFESFQKELVRALFDVRRLFDVRCERETRFHHDRLDRIVMHLLDRPAFAGTE